MASHEQRLPKELERRTKLLEKMDEAVAGLKKRAEQEQVKEQAKYQKLRDIQPRRY